jgi:hypothetical protein
MKFLINFCLVTFALATAPRPKTTEANVRSSENFLRHTFHHITIGLL